MIIVIANNKIKDKIYQDALIFDSWGEVREEFEGEEDKIAFVVEVHNDLSESALCKGDDVRDFISHLERQEAAE